MNDYTSLLIGGVFGLIVFLATIWRMNRKAKQRHSAKERQQPTLPFGGSPESAGSHLH